MWPIKVVNSYIRSAIMVGYAQGVEQSVNVFISWLVSIVYSLSIPDKQPILKGGLTLHRALKNGQSHKISQTPRVYYIVLMIFKKRNHQPTFKVIGYR